MATRLRVVVIGGGTGGLCLAQALHRAGVTVSVYERSRSHTDRSQGYRVRINPHGSAALRACLPAELWQRFVDGCGTRVGARGFVDHRLRELLRVDDVPDQEQRSVSRAALHEVLSSGLDDVLHYGKEFETYHRAGDGTVTCLFADGSTTTADLVIGADGANSRVRKQFLPHAERVDTGIVAIAGKFPLSTETKGSLPDRIYKGQHTVIPPRGCGMFVAPHELGDDSYVLWAYAAHRDRYPTEVGLSELDGVGLRDLVGGLILQWHPVLRLLVAESPPESVSLLPILTSVPVPRWPTTNITLLGDAIHSMTPFRGIGANTALRDAQLLSRNLIAVDRGDRALLAAVGDYETEMIDYGFAAVRSSLRTGMQLVSENRFGRTVFKAVLRGFTAVPPLKRKVFGAL